MANFDNTLKTSKPKLILLKQQDNLIKHKPIRELVPIAADRHSVRQNDQ